MYDANMVDSTKAGEEFIRLLLAVDGEFDKRNDFSVPGLKFTRVAFTRAMPVIRKLAPDALVVIYNANTPIDASFEEIRDYTALLCTPVILYSTEFDVGARNTAIALGFDDYYFGSSAETLLRKIRIMRKIREYDREEYRLQAEKNVRTKTGVLVSKQIIDASVSALALTALSPLLVLIAIIIKLESKGPVFYISKRAGRNYKIFDFYKFRSMCDGADAKLQELMGQNQYGGGPFVKIQSDPRVTTFGKFLRKTSLDEIPQLLNVIKGDMFLVGNRPLPLYEAIALTNDEIARRFLAPAGLTGLWQITKRGKVDMSEVERIDLDIIYARKHSLLYDLKLLVNTVPALLQKEPV